MSTACYCASLDCALRGCLRLRTSPGQVPFWPSPAPGQTGWVCPKCSTSNSPEQRTCYHCDRQGQSNKIGEQLWMPDNYASFGSNGGVGCDTLEGPCACGAWH